MPDLLRLLVVALIGWTALRDVRTRRVPNVVWYPAAGLGVVVLAWELLGRVPPVGLADRLFLLRVLLSLGFVVPLVYLFWRFGAFGGADAKAFMVVAVVFPTYPTYHPPGIATPLPVVETALGVFSLTVLTNTVLAGLAVPIALAVRNALAGDVAPIMPLGRRMRVEELPTAHGKLFETPRSYTRNGLDLDALRMYLRWRGTTLSELRAEPKRYRDPSSVGETAAPGDGAVREWDGLLPDGGESATVRAEGTTPHAEYDDPWGAEAFLDDIEGDAYGTTPAKLRDALELVTARDAVWISPGIPFLVPTFVGLLVALTYGDVLFGLMAAVGLV